jgi:hypothetical protein
MGKLPVKYLGIPLHHDRLRREDLQPLIEKLYSKRLLGGEGNFYSLLPKESLSKLVWLVFVFICFPFSNSINGP